MASQRTRQRTRRREQQRRRALIAAATAGVSVLVAAGVALAVASGSGSSPAATTGEEVASVAGRPAADGELPDLEFTRFHSGETDRLGAYAGRPLVINFFASWCVPCLAELPRFEQAYQQHKDQVQFLGLNLQDSQRSAARVVAETGLNYPIGVDPQGRLFQALGGFGMPTTLFVAADGTVLERHTGELSAEQLVDRLETHGMVNPGT
jgi:cytochrome c biogenesis protein CcmG/thiol:disulfide interchange protein DsbE